MTFGPFDVDSMKKILVFKEDLDEKQTGMGGTTANSNICIPKPMEDRENPDPNNSLHFQKDTNLHTKLPLWKEAFFWILTQYYEEFCNNGNQIPDEIIFDTQTYRETNDYIGNFINSEIERTNYLNDIIYIDDGEIFSFVCLGMSSFPLIRLDCIYFYLLDRFLTCRWKSTTHNTVRH